MSAHGPRAGERRSAWANGTLGLFLLLIARLGVGNPEPHYLVYTGAFTDLKSQGIYAFRFDAATAKLSPLGLAVAAKNPTHFAVHPNGRFLYAVVNLPDATGGVSGYEINRKSGKLKLLNTVSSRGSNSCFVSVTPSGKYVLLANYASGSVACYRVTPDGRLGEATGFVQHTGSSVNRDRQEGPHAHSINASPEGRLAIAADLGTDQLLVYRLRNGKLIPNDPPFTAVTPRSGPRHFVFHPSGQYAYAIEELASAITAFAYDARRGILRETQTISTLLKGFAGSSFAADVQVHPSGKFVYGSNRGDDTIAVFAVQAATGKLIPVQNATTGGKTPRIFAIDPTGSFLIAANEGSGTLVVFRINGASGRLSDSGERTEAPKPTCVKFVSIPLG
jgi:6-phosphogluconolactonase